MLLQKPTKTEITIDYLKDNLTYDCLTGVFIWKQNRGKRYCKGKVAGTISKHGYVHINIDGFIYRAHRLAWFYVYECWPKELDHINRIRTDNRILNLRECNRSENMRNKVAKIGTKTGVKHVFLHGSNYRVQINVDGKSLQFGTYKDIDLAELIATEAREKYHGRFARNA